MILPWFIYDLSNRQLITTSTIPSGEIGDTKNIVFTETPILGNNYSPVSVGGHGNRKISMQIPIINRGYEGNIGLVKQFDLLRNRSRGWLGLKKKNLWATNPKVLYYWGVGSIPLEYFVTRCDMKHTTMMVNEVGLPQHTVIDLELTLDETSMFYKVEETYRDITAVLGSAQTALQARRGWL